MMKRRAPPPHTALLNMVLFHRVLAVNGKTVDTTAVDMNVANVTYVSQPRTKRLKTLSASP